MNLAKVAAALADPVRIAILNLLAASPGQGCCTELGRPAEGVCVCEFAQRLGISQPRVSYHLKILRGAGLVTERPYGKWTYYTIVPSQVEAFCSELCGAAGILASGGNRHE